MASNEKKLRPSFLDTQIVSKPFQNKLEKCSERSYSTGTYSDYSYFAETSGAFQPTPIAMLWTILSVLLAGTLTFCLLQPHWYINPKTETTFGPFGYCVVSSPGMTIAFPTGHQRRLGISGRLSVPTRMRCGMYTRQFQLSNVASRSWQAAAALYGAGCMLETIAAVIALASSLPVSRKSLKFMKCMMGRRAVVIAGCLQVIAGTYI